MLVSKEQLLQLESNEFEKLLAYSEELADNILMFIGGLTEFAELWIDDTITPRSLFDDCQGCRYENDE